MTQDETNKKSPSTSTALDLQETSSLSPAPDTTKNQTASPDGDDPTISHPAPSLNRRELLASIPEIAIGLGLAAGEQKAQAFNNMMMFVGGVNQPIVESYGLWAFGNNPSGQLGVGDLVNRSRPAKIGSLSNWAALARGWR